VSKERCQQNNLRLGTGFPARRREAEKDQQQSCCFGGATTKKLALPAMNLSLRATRGSAAIQFHKKGLDKSRPLLSKYISGNVLINFLFVAFPNQKTARALFLGTL